MTNNHAPIRVAVVGAGYWGPNLARNLAAAPDFELVALCDRDEDRARSLAARVGQPPVYASLHELLGARDLDAVAVATPAGTHHALVMQALQAGKHVLVEKPLADSVAAGEEMVATAQEAGLTLMADHTYCYTPAVTKIKELIDADQLGEILYVDSVRINLGLVQPDVDVFWDLAPHDLSVLDYILPGGLPTYGVSAQGADPLGAGKACVGYLSLPLGSDALAHVHVNWLSPTKIRQMVIGGSRRTLLWDDLNPQQRISVFDRGVDLSRQADALEDAGKRAAAHVSYRLGDTWSPALPEYEPLGRMVAQFAASIREHSPSPTDGVAALRVLTVLAAAADCLEHDSRRRFDRYAADWQVEVAL